MRGAIETRLAAAAFALLAGACDRGQPPGARAESSASASVVAGSTDGGSADGGGDVPGSDRLGTVRDNLPFAPTGKKIGSIAWRTWVYTDTGPKRTRYGYLRAGAVVDARGPEIVNEGCSGGWYRINPRGFVCIGKGATEDENHPVLKASAQRPLRGNALPYTYAMAGDVPPVRYFRIPTVEDMNRVEGEGVLNRVRVWRERMRALGTHEFFSTPPKPPDFLANIDHTPKPYGVEKRLHFSVHTGKAAPGSGFALAHVFESSGRLFGLTTDLDIIALDRTDVVKPSEFHGTELGEGEDLPLAFVRSHYAPRYVEDDSGNLKQAGEFAYRQPVKLTGKTRAGGQSMYETSDGHWLPAASARILSPREDFPSFAKANRKWIDISIRNQSLVAYVGTKPVYATLVSTGRGGMADPEKSFATVRGTFMVHSKHVSTTMDGEEDKSDGYALLDVPFVQYFHEGYALHGTYWHDEYGKERSHGCVNLAPIDAAWLFEWTDPVVPTGWHSVLNKDRGTVVYVHG